MCVHRHRSVSSTIRGQYLYSLSSSQVSLLQRFVPAHCCQVKRIKVILEFYAGYPLVITASDPQTPIRPFRKWRPESRVMPKAQITQLPRLTKKWHRSHKITLSDDKETYCMMAGSNGWGAQHDCKPGVPFSPRCQPRVTPGNNKERGLLATALTLCLECLRQHCLRLFLPVFSGLLFNVAVSNVHPWVLDAREGECFMTSETNAGGEVCIFVVSMPVTPAARRGRPSVSALPPPVAA